MSDLTLSSLLKEQALLPARVQRALSPDEVRSCHECPVCSGGLLRRRLPGRRGDCEQATCKSCGSSGLIVWPRQSA